MPRWAYTDNFIALLAADAFVTQRTDGSIVDNRNLFRVKPTFKYTNAQRLSPC